MIANKNTFFLLPMLVGIVLISVWFIHPLQSEKSHTTDTPPDTIMEGVTTFVFNASGHPQMKMTTPKIIHYAENNTSYLEKPIITLFHETGNPWSIHSQYAKMLGLDEVVFWDDVSIDHKADQASPNTTIKAPQLTVYPKTQQAETNSRIMMMQPNLMITSIGMIADLKQDHIQLLSQTEAIYLPN